MRIKNLIIGEMRFLVKYGIVPLYGVITALYLCILAALPITARETAAIILVYTDPAAMGLFFMGAVVLFEKSQRVESSLAVSPVKIGEYIFAKVVPLMVIGIIVGVLLCIFAGISNIVFILLGVGLGSVLFSLCGLFVASKVDTLNGFIVAVVPFEIFLCVPAILFIFGILKSQLWILHPGVAAIQLIMGQSNVWIGDVLVLLVWIVLAFMMCRSAVTKSFRTMGGAKI